MNESEIRELLILHLSAKHSDEPHLAFIKEIFIDNFKCRADLVMANGSALAFEIKSELDSLNRLPNQLECLASHFDEVIVVCAEKHLSNTLGMVDDGIGVWCIGADSNFRVAKKAKKQKPSKEQWLSHLPVVELKGFLRENFLPRSGDRETLVGMALTRPLQVIRQYVIEYFKRREERISAIKEKRRLAIVDRPQKSNDELLREYLSTINMSRHIKAIPRQIRRH